MAPYAVCWQSLSNRYKSLHITNGDSAVTGMREAGIVGDILAWRDVLHIGPVQNKPCWQAFDQARIEFLVAAELADRVYVEQTFAARMAVMNKIHQYDSIYLWFEHDLYDQLQLLQVLIWLSSDVQIHSRIKLIVTDMYLGQASSANYHELFRFSEPLQIEHLATAASYWRAFTHNTPLLLPSLKKSAVLPFMYPAFKRLCAEYPSYANGLNQVQNSLLELSDQAAHVAELFSLYQSTEAAKFMGDSIFALVVKDLLKDLNQCKTPVLVFDNEQNNVNIWHHKLSLTDVGHAILRHQSHYLNLSDINIWIGGVHICKDNLWCYDNSSGQFVVWSSE